MFFLKYNKRGRSIIVVFISIGICFQILTPCVSSPAAVVSSGDIIRMDYDIILNSDLSQLDALEDVNVYIGNSIPLALAQEYIIKEHPEVFWSKLLGSTVPSTPFRITLTAIETLNYDESDIVYGKGIHYDITIYEIVYDDSVTRNPLNQIPFLVEALVLLITGVIIFTFYALYKRYSHLFKRTKKCTLCIGVADGKCLKCGIVYCRSCFFEKGCPECRSNHFKPF